MPWNVRSRGRLPLCAGALVVALVLSLTIHVVPRGAESAELVVVGAVVTHLYLMRARRRAMERMMAERTEALGAAEKSELRYRKLLEVSSDAILLANDRGILMANEAAVKMFQVRDREALKGRRFEEFLTPASRTVVEECRAALPANEIRVPLKEVQMQRGGAVVDAEISGAAYVDEEGLTTQCVIRDITERKRAERALRESEENFRQLAENIREVFFVYAPAARQMLYVSPAYEQIWGRSRESVYRDPTAWREAVHEEDVEQARLSAAGPLTGEAVDCEYRICTPEGVEKWIRSRSFPVRDGDGELIRVVGLAEEITERKRYEAELIRAREGAEAANRAKSMFLATMGHELRTPLNAILGFAELLEVEVAERGVETSKKDIQKIRRSGQHLLALINDVMDYSKIEAGKMELQAEWFDIAELVRDVAAGVEPQAARNGVEIVVVCGPATLYGDRVRIGQCLFNLVGNACKFTHDGRVVVEAGAEGGWYTVRIIDTGIGIRAEDLGKLFCNFTQLETFDGRKYGGAGLGLAISRKLSRMMGGDITVESVAGQGSTFTLRIPVGAAPVPAPAAD